MSVELKNYNNDFNQHRLEDKLTKLLKGIITNIVKNNSVNFQNLYFSENTQFN